ncbi:hypothetical protein [uncultured Brevibacillus sp.]|uniref:hypothetical protein n=1 Tax=uncultured Brevibacillus sp. TaxID=169970 RepID=UPI002593D153|nr:hypothetical protein [uncultured Brevibacillus sp.]
MRIAIQQQAQTNFENDKSAQLENQRKLFIADIALIVSEYITDISHYYFASRHSPQIQEELLILKRKIDEKDLEIKNNPNSIEVLNTEKHTLLLKPNAIPRKRKARTT